MNPIERADLDRAVLELRSALDGEAFAAAWAEGRTLPLEQAISLALEGSTNGNPDAWDPGR